MGKLFGTDGIRGRANSYPMTCELAMKLGQALGLSTRASGNTAVKFFCLGFQHFFFYNNNIAFLG